MFSLKSRFNLHVNLFLVLAVQLTCVLCSKVGPGEHGNLAFENNSLNTIYVASLFPENLEGQAPLPRRFNVSEKYCGIAPGEINYETLSLYSSGLCYSYEDVLLKSKSYDRILVYVVPFYPPEDSYLPKPLFDYKLVCYELTYDDLVFLDFHLYYPPNEKMKNVKMDPPYESFKIIYR